MDEDATGKQQVTLTAGELKYLDKICNKPIAQHKRSLQWTALYHGLGLPLVLIALILINIYRNPTVKEASVFIAFQAILNSCGCLGASYLLYRHTRMIHHLQAELQHARRSE